MRMVRRSGIRANGSGWEEWEQEKVGEEAEAEVERWSEMVKQRKRREKWRIARRQPALSSQLSALSSREGIGREGLGFE
jgi:hypothetical protein